MPEIAERVQRRCGDRVPGSETRLTPPSLLLRGRGRPAAAAELGPKTGSLWQRQQPKPSLNDAGAGLR